jgi:hypothetical protein
VESVAEGLQRNRQVVNGLVRGVSSFREGSKMLSSLFRPQNSSGIHRRPLRLLCAVSTSRHANKERARLRGKEAKVDELFPLMAEGPRTSSRWLCGCCPRRGEGE